MRATASSPRRDGAGGGGGAAAAAGSRSFFGVTSSSRTRRAGVASPRPIPGGAPAVAARNAYHKCPRVPPVPSCARPGRALDCGHFALRDARPRVAASRSGGPVPAPDPAEVRRLVEAAVARVLGDGDASSAAAAPSPPPVPAAAPVARPAKVVDWTRPAVGDTRPVAASPPPPSGRPAARGAKAAAPDPARTVAIGGDHGGYA